MAKTSRLSEKALAELDGKLHSSTLKRTEPSGLLRPRLIPSRRYPVSNGPASVCDITTRTLALEKGEKIQSDIEVN